MKIIKLDASDWRSALDFYEAILPAIGAPEWHGKSVAAITESMVWGEINSLEPPYAVEIHSAQNAPHEVIQQIKWIREDLVTQRSAFKERYGHDVDVNVDLVG